MVQPRRGPTPPLSYAADCRAALCEHWRLRPDVIAEGEVAADIQPNLEQNGLPSTGGVWTRYVQGVLEEFYIELRCGIGCAAHLDSHPSEEFGGTVVQAVVPAYRRRIQDTSLPISANPFLAPEEGQVRGQVGKENALVYTENPQVHWPSMDLQFFPPLSSICTRHHTPELTSLGRTYHPSIMKILLS